MATVPVSRRRTRSPLVFLSLLWPTTATAVPIHHTRHSLRFFFPLLFVSPFVSLSFLLFARSGFLCATVTASHGYKMSAKVLVKGFARMSWVTFSMLLMWTGRCRKQPRIIELMWNVLVLICFILQLYHCLEHKTWIMEKINDPFLANGRKHDSHFWSCSSVLSWEITRPEEMLEGGTPRLVLLVAEWIQTVW